MLIVTAGGWQSHYGQRGINGPIDDLLFPINHGVLHYPGYEVLPSFVVYQADRTDEDRFRAIQAPLQGRMRTLFTSAPVPFRKQNGGDYAIPSMEPLPQVAPGTTGFAAHVGEPAIPAS